MSISCSFYYVIIGKCFTQKHRILLITICFCSGIQNFAQHTLFLLEKHKNSLHTLFSLEKHKNSLSALYFRSKNQKIHSAYFIFARETHNFAQHTIFSLEKTKNSLSAPYFHSPLLQSTILIK